MAQQINIVQAAFIVALFHVILCQQTFSRMAKEAAVLDQLVGMGRLPFLSDIRPDGQREIGTVDVEITRLYVKILNVDERQSVVDLSLIVDTTWQDDRMRWDTPNPNCTQDCLSDLKTIHSKPAASYHMWTPDLVPYNADRQWLKNPKLTVNSSGAVMYSLRSTFGVSCEFDTTDFPHDKASCVIKYGSVMYTKNELKLILSKLDDSEEIGMYKHHSDWRVRVSTAIVENRSDIDNDIYLQMVVNMTRIPTYFRLIYTSPVLVMASYLPILHLLPPNSQAKLILPSLCSVAVVILISTFEANIGRFPPGGSPLIVINYVFLLILFLVSTVWSCFTSSLAVCKHTTQAVPVFLRKFLQKSIVRRMCTFGNDRLADVPEVRFSHQKMNDDNEQIMSNDTLNNTGRTDSLQLLCNFTKEMEARQRMEREWYQIAVILDRVAAAVFALLLVVSYIMQM